MSQIPSGPPPKSPPPSGLPSSPPPAPPPNPPQSQSSYTGQGERYDVGVWGASGVGKTLLLSAAVQKLREEVGYRPPQEGSKAKTRPSVYYEVQTEAGHATESVAKHFLDYISSEFASGIFPGATTAGDENTDARPFLLRVSYKDTTGDGRIGRFHRLHFMDVAGENVSETNPGHAYWDNLQRTRGILFVVDGDRNRTEFNQGNQSINQLVSNFISMMGGSPGLKDKFLAVCITKADMNYNSPRDVPTETEDIEKELQRLLNSSMQPLLGPFREQNEADNRYKVFITSGVGWCQQRGEWAKNVDPSTIGKDDRGTKMLDKEQWRTYHTVYPLLWLFDQIERDNERRYRPALLQRLIRRNRISNVDILTSVYGQTDLL